MEKSVSGVLTLSLLASRSCKDSGPADVLCYAGDRLTEQTCW